MAILKCKMCGGDLTITTDEKIVECEFCGTTQTIPDGNDEKKTNLFNRANRLRIANEFDKAAGIYESIIAEFPDDPESYWGLCLCKFGIEYVDDPKTAKKIPTCHRTSFESIFDDGNYKLAIEKSDVIAQGVYKEEAAVIDNLQKDILSIAHKEDPFDVFICYKETDELGQRTPDSVFAQEIYDALTAKGFKVFFSRITLEDKLGKQYEPYIFAALNSAKVMLAIGTKEEYYNAVWVKNEWSRFLSLMEKDKEKMLIPCYRDIDPYDMPQEFKNLQGQDMGKLGFLQDLVRGVSKIVAPENNKPVNAESAPTTPVNATTDSLLKRAFMFLEDGNWQSADEYCEKVLDITPECAEAYLGKLMAELHVKRQDALKNIEKPFNDNNNYQKTIRFGDKNLKSELEGYISYIKERNETARKDKIYYDAKASMNENTIDGCNKAIRLFKTIPSYKDSDSLITECETKIVDLKEQAVIDSKNSVYNKGIHLMETRTMSSYKSALSCFESIPDWKDSNDKINECKRVVKELEAEMEQRLKEKKEKEEQERIEKEKQAEAERKEKARISKKRKKIAIIVISLVVAMIAFVILLNIIINTIIIPTNKYNKAISAEHNGEYTTALTMFMELDDFKDSKKHINHILSSKREIFDKVISTGLYHSVALKLDGTVIATGDNSTGQCDVSDWSNIIEVSAGNYHTVGLKSDGTVIATGCNSNYSNYKQCEVYDWSDIIEISAGHIHTVGLEADGTVVAVGDNRNGQCNVSEWQNIVAISAGSYHTIGLKSDGTVVAAGANYDGVCDVSEWQDIVAVSAGGSHTVGLKSNGTVVAIGDNSDGQCNVQDWKDIVSISTGTYDTVGLKLDGTVVTTRNNNHENFDFSNWSDILALTRGNYHSIGLKKDGTVIAVGANNKGECDVEDWNLFK